MTGRILIVPYKMGSASGRALKEAINERGLRRAVRVRPEWARRVFRSDLLVNWGATTIPIIPVGSIRAVLNWPEAVAIAQNKRTFFEHMPEDLVPEYTTDPDVAREWARDGITVVCRTLLRASCGRGIVLINEENADELPNNCQLFVKYVKKMDEYRLHVHRTAQGEYRVFDAQQKRRRAGVKDVDSKIRNSDNGWVFCREDLNIPEVVYTNARRALEACGLDFGAVDVIYNRHYERAYTLEINTAPGLEGTTLETYTNMLETY